MREKIKRCSFKTMKLTDAYINDTLKILFNLEKDTNGYKY